MSVDTALISTKQGFRISGDLAFATVAELPETGREKIQTHPGDDFCIDLASLERIDSAGIALLLGWKRDCIKAHKNCYFKSIPQQAKRLIDTYKLGACLRIVNLLRKS